MSPDSPPDLASLSDAELQRLAYGRVDGSSPSATRMRALAAAELASRRPSAPSLSPTVLPPPVAASPSTITRHASDAGDVSRHVSRDASRHDDADLDGADAEIADLEVADTDDDPPPWWRRRSALLGAAIIGAALLVSGTVQQLSIPHPPPAYAAFDTDETVDDRLYLQELEARGERLRRDPRVLEAVRLPGVGSPYRLVASVIGPQNSELAEQDVCVTVFLERSPLSRSCVDYPDFLETGVAGGANLFGLDVAYSWDAEGASRLDVLPTGPSTLSELSAIGLPAIDQLRDAPPGIPDTVASSARRPVTVEPLLGPSVIEEIPGWLLLGEVGVTGPPGSELAVCVWATQRDFPSPIVDSRCVLASEFARDGISNDDGPGIGSVFYAWRASGDIAFDVLGFNPR